MVTRRARKLVVEKELDALHPQQGRLEEGHGWERSPFLSGVFMQGREGNTSFDIRVSMVAHTSEDIKT